MICQKNLNLHLTSRKKPAEELRESIATGNEEVGNAILNGLYNFMEQTRRSSEFLTKLTKSNVRGASIFWVPTDLRISKSKSHFISSQIDEKGFTINPNCSWKPYERKI